MIDTEKENIYYDCSRGCTISRNKETGELVCTYRAGCCKLETYDWLKGVNQEQYEDLYEVRFKNTRKDVYRNTSGQHIKTGDFVIVEANNGHDLGIVTLEGPVVGRQMRSKNIRNDSDIKKIYRKANSFDIEKWYEAIGREQETMIKARRIAEEMELDMKIGDVEYQGDGTKAIFYYIADGRVDFRRLIKVYAAEFRIRIEMKQIGARQEAGLIGGLGVCGRELCCANHITDFKSITTSSARCQDLSLNPQKLAGQCGKLKCCLNYEVQSYLDAKSRIPRVQEPLQFKDGYAYLVKTDVLAEKMYFSYDEHSSLGGLYELTAEQVFEVIRLNRSGIKPNTMKAELDNGQPKFVSAVGDDSISRFDDSSNGRKRRGRSNRKNKRRTDSNNRGNGQRSENRPNGGQKNNRNNGQNNDKKNGNNRRNDKRSNGGNHSNSGKKAVSNGTEA